MDDNIKLNKELIRNNPNKSGNQLYQESKASGIGIRKTNFLGLVREVRNLPEPTLIKRVKSTPKIYRKAKPSKPTKPKAKPKAVKLPKLEFKDTKFGKIVKKLEKEHNIKESKAILHARKILKIDKSDYHKINQKDVQILLHETP